MLIKRVHRIEQLADSSKVVKPKPNINKWDGEDIEEDVKVRKFCLAMILFNRMRNFRYDIMMT